MSPRVSSARCGVNTGDALTLDQLLDMRLHGVDEDLLEEAVRRRRKG